MKSSPVVPRKRRAKLRLLDERVAAVIELGDDTARLVAVVASSGTTLIELVGDVCGSARSPAVTVSGSSTLVAGASVVVITVSWALVVFVVGSAVVVLVVLVVVGVVVLLGLLAGAGAAVLALRFGFALLGRVLVGLPLAVVAAVAVPFLAFVFCFGFTVVLLVSALVDLAGSSIGGLVGVGRLVVGVVSLDKDFVEAAAPASS